MNNDIIRASARSVKVSAQKLLRVTSSVVGYSPIFALQMLRHSNLKSARIVEKLILSAVSNAENNFSLDSSGLIIKSIVVGKAASLKRFVARGRGKSNVLKKHYSNIYIEIKSCN